MFRLIFAFMHEFYWLAGAAAILLAVAGFLGWRSGGRKASRDIQEMEKRLPEKYRKK